MTPEFSDALRQWYRDEYKRRTKLLDTGEGRLDWVDKGTRVSFAEICYQADLLSTETGELYNVVELRQMFGEDPLKC